VAQVGRTRVRVALYQKNALGRHGKNSSRRQARR
jgi:hypothetical protein